MGKIGELDPGRASIEGDPLNVDPVVLAITAGDGIERWPAQQHARQISIFDSVMHEAEPEFGTPRCEP